MLPQLQDSLPPVTYIKSAKEQRTSSTSRKKGLDMHGEDLTSNRSNGGNINDRGRSLP